MHLPRDFLSSRKAQAVGILILVGLWGTEIGLSELQLEGLTTALIAYIAGRAIVDHGIAVAAK